MMNLFFATRENTLLADKESLILKCTKEAFFTDEQSQEVDSPDKADAIIMQEDSTTFKEFRYIDKMLNDPFVGKYYTKIYTINADDSATGLLRGLYTSMPYYRMNPMLHKAVPYYNYTNQLVFTDKTVIKPTYLAAWYGNTKSNDLRKRLVKALQDNGHFSIKTSQSWYNHKEDEQKAYVDLIKDSKFSLCPAGWAPASPRIYESMVLGRCPVIIADKINLPKGPHWSDFSLFFPEKKSLAELETFLLNNEHRYEELGANAKEAWDTFFAGDKLKQYFANSLLSLIRSTPVYTKEMELKRWRSFETYWNNKWAIPQRICRKLNIPVVTSGWSSQR